MSLSQNIRILMLWLLLCPLPFLLVLLASSLAHADDWDTNTGQDLPPIPEENRIIKWCKKDGNGVRYASANLEIPGYEPCGKLEVEMTCDAGGGRHIGSAVAGQYGNRDCALGPRIIIQRTDSIEPQETNQTSEGEASREVAGPEEDPTTENGAAENEIGDAQDETSPEQTDEDSFADGASENQEPQHVESKKSEQPGKKLTAQERRNLEREVKELEKQQLSEEKMIEQLLISGMLGTPLTPTSPPTSRSGKRSSANQAKQQRKEMEKVLNSLDPESKKMLEKMFGVKDIKDVLKPRR